MNATRKLYARASALPAIAAALALSSTPSFAQDATPQVQPAPTEPAPASTEPTAPTADPLAPDPAATTTSTTTKTTTVRRPARAHVTAARATTAKAAPTPTHAARPVASQPAAPVAAAPAAPAPAQPPAAPVVDLAAHPAPPPAAKPATSAEDMLPYAAGALALLALAATAAVVAGRRRRRRAQEAADEETLAYEPFETAPATETEAGPEPVIHDEQPPIVAPSAFAWGNQPQADENRRSDEPTAGRDDRDDRRPGETWVERAYRGPSPNNPSASLRNRLSRAAFFDKRERDVAAGLAEPIDPDAGLPDALVEEQDRELA